MTALPRFGFALLLALAWFLASVAAPPSSAQNSPRMKTGFVTTSDGTKIHYVEAGQVKTVGSFQIGGAPPPGAMTSGQVSVSNIRQQPTILFVPGWTMAADIWEKQIAYFSKNYRVVAMDPRAQGKSTKATDGLYPASRAADIKAVVDQLKLAPVVIVAWSMGVTETAAYVDQFGTGTLAGIVLVDGFPGFEASPEMSNRMIGLLLAMQKDRRKTTEAFVRSMYKTPQTEDYIKHVIDTSIGMPTSAAVAVGLAGFMTDNRPALAKIDKPTLIITASAGPFAAAYEDMHKRIAGSRLEVLDNAGHALFVDQPERFNSLLEEFLKALH